MEQVNEQKLGNPLGYAPVGKLLKPVSYTHLDVYKRQGLGAEIHFPLFLACLWKIQREDYGRAREITRKESGCYGRLFQRSFCMPECLQSDWAQESIFHYFWPVCGKRKEKTVILQMEIT